MTEQRVASDTEVVIVGGGAAGIAAARRLHDAQIDCLLLEARPRLGGRAWTVTRPNRCRRSRLRLAAFGRPQSLGGDCPGARPHDRQDAAALDAALASDRLSGVRAGRLPGRAAERSSPARLARGSAGPSAARFLEPHGRWNNLITAVGTYVSGAEFDRVSARDFGRYDDSGVNCRVVEGYGTVIAAHAAGVPVVLGCPVRRIDRSGPRLRVETANGAIAADAAIVTVPSGVLAEETACLHPYPARENGGSSGPAARAGRQAVPVASMRRRVRQGEPSVRPHRPQRNGNLSFRPFGRPQIEAYFGGSLAAELEAGGEAAFFDFAVAELTGLLGSDFARRVKPLHIHPLGRRSVLARLLLLCPAGQGGVPRRARRAGGRSPVLRRRGLLGGDFSTAHGAYLTGVAAADAIPARRSKGRQRS